MNYYAYDVVGGVVRGRLVLGFLCRPHFQLLTGTNNHFGSKGVRKLPEGFNRWHLSPHFNACYLRLFDAGHLCQFSLRPSPFFAQFGDHDGQSYLGIGLAQLFGKTWIALNLFFDVLAMRFHRFLCLSLRCRRFQVDYDPLVQDFGDSFQHFEGVAIIIGILKP